MTSGQTKTRLVFFGNERLVSGIKQTNASILRGLIDQGYDIAAIVAHHTDAKSRNARQLEVAVIAEENAIPLLTPKNPLECYDELAAMHADAAILVAYGRIIPQKLIDLFPRGIINVHPSLLPHYRGSTPLEAPILHGDTTSGVSIMQLTAAMDAGPVYAQASFPIEPIDTKFDLYEKATVLATKLLLDALPKILDGSLLPATQNDADASYCPLLSKADGYLSPTTQTATEAERCVRAFLGFPKSRLTVLGHQIIITKAHLASQQKTPLDVMFSDGAYLSIDELTAPSGKTMNAEAFLRGYAAR